MGQRKARLGRVTDVDLRLLHVFQTVVNCGGLSAAEIDLGIGRSTISTHIAELEGRLGTRLCQRGRGGFSLTARGKGIYEASLALMKSLDDFRLEINSGDDVMTGDLSVGIADNVIWDRDARLSEVFREFSAVASEVDLTVYILSPDEIEQRLLTGRLHIGIAPQMHEITGLAFEPLFDEVNYLYCGRGHPLFDVPDKEITTADLVRSQYVKKGYAVNSKLQQANSSMGKRVIGFHVEAFAMLILSGRYIGFLPEDYAAVWESKGELRKLQPKRYEAIVSFVIMTARGRPESAAQAAFASKLRQVRDTPAAGSRPATTSTLRAPSRRGVTPS